MIAIPAGVLCAVRKSTATDRIISVAAVILVSCPVFPTCMLMILTMSRTSMIQELKSNYAETASAKSLLGHTILFRHAFKNAVIPVITVAGTQIGATIAGSALVENVFSLPGPGSLLISGINTSEYPIVRRLWKFRPCVRSASADFAQRVANRMAAG